MFSSPAHSFRIFVPAGDMAAVRDHRWGWDGVLTHVSSGIAVVDDCKMVQPSKLRTESSRVRAMKTRYVA